MSEVIQCAAAKAPEVIVAALERAKFGQPAEVPFTDERGAVTCLLQQGRERRMLPGQAHISRGTNRFLQADWKAVLIATGDQSGSGSGADARTRVRLRKFRSGCRQVVDVRSCEVATPVAGKIGIPEIVRHDEHDVRLPGGDLDHGDGTRCDRYQRLPASNSLQGFATLGGYQFMSHVPPSLSTRMISSSRDGR